MFQRFRNFLRSTFTDLPWWKRKLLQVSAILIVIGGGAAAYAATQSEELAWSGSTLRAGVGGFFGFLIGAGIRLFLKIGLLLGVVVAGVIWGVSALGWVDLPWGSFGEVSSAVGGWITDQFGSLQTFLTGYLPTSALSGVGLASGITTKPEVDLNPFDDE